MMERMCAKDLACTVCRTSLFVNKMTSVLANFSNLLFHAHNMGKRDY